MTPVTALTPRPTISPFSAYSFSTLPCVSSANGIPSATATTRGRVNGLKPVKPNVRSGAYVRAYERLWPPVYVCECLSYPTPQPSW